MKGNNKKKDEVQDYRRSSAKNIYTHIYIYKYKNVQEICELRNRVALNVYYETDTTSPDT